jgi:hypothetical protein
MLSTATRGQQQTACSNPHNIHQLVPNKTIPRHRVRHRWNGSAQAWLYADGPLAFSAAVVKGFQGCGRCASPSPDEAGLLELLLVERGGGMLQTASRPQVRPSTRATARTAAAHSALGELGVNPISDLSLSQAGRRREQQCDREVPASPCELVKSSGSAIARAISHARDRDVDAVAVSGRWRVLPVEESVVLEESTVGVAAVILSLGFGF